MDGKKIILRMRRNVSSPNLYHYTKKFSNLDNIIRGKCFELHYVLETFFFIAPNLQYRIPMVCFTDLPQGTRARHRKRYGDYGIVLKKEWAKNQGVCPVIYCRTDGNLTNIIKAICKNSSPKLQIKILSYCKPYYAHFYDSKTSKWSGENIRFYDEREWRYVPLEFDDAKIGAKGLGKISFTDDDIVRVYVKSIEEQKWLSEIVDINKIKIT